MVPIVNENDTVATDELMGVKGKYGDNDSLSALVAGLVEADWLFLLTDVDRLYTADPRTNPDAQPLDYVADIDALGIDESEDTAGSGFGTGGIGTKLNAFRLATAAGVQCVLCHSQRAEHICKFVQGTADAVGTIFAAKEDTRRPVVGNSDGAAVSLDNKKKWIAHGIAPKGRLIIDAGAVRALLRKKSLLAAGITEVRSTQHSLPHPASRTAQPPTQHSLPLSTSHTAQPPASRLLHSTGSAAEHWSPGAAH